MSNYQPPSATSSPRFCNMGNFMRLPKAESAEGLDFAIIGIPFDTASSLPYRFQIRSERHAQYLSNDQAKQCDHGSKHHGKH